VPEQPARRGVDREETPRSVVVIGEGKNDDALGDRERGTLAGRPDAPAPARRFGRGWEEYRGGLGRIRIGRERLDADRYAVPRDKAVGRRRKIDATEERRWSVDVQRVRSTYDPRRMAMPRECSDGGPREPRENRGAWLIMRQ
jgi:hypothetical protein